MTTTLDPAFLQAVLKMVGFKPTPMLRAQSALLLIGLDRAEFTAADLPSELGGRHLSGAATGALIAQGLLTVLRREPSPNPNAKGRKLDVLQLTNRQKARTWLLANGVYPEHLDQPELELLPALHSSSSSEGGSLTETIHQ